MALSTFVGSFATPGSTGAHSETGLGFQPQAILFWGDPNTADADATATFRTFIGMATGSTSRAAVSMNNQSAFGAYHANDKCVYLLDSGNAAWVVADFTSFDADGFTVNFSNVTGVGAIINYLALGGADLSNAAIKQITAPASTGSQAYTGVGFKPDAIIALSIGSTTAPDSLNASHPDIGLGAASGSTARWTTTNDWSGTSAEAYQRTNAVIAVIDSNTKLLEADITSFDADGFTLNWGTTTSGAYVWFLCLKGGKYQAGSLAQPAATGNQGTTGVGFQPLAELFASRALAAGTTISAGTTRNEQMMIGAMKDATHRGVTSYNWASSPSAAHQMLNRTNAIRMLDSGGAAPVVSSADYVSQDSDGFTVNWGTADATAREVLYLAFGSSAVTVPDAPTIGTVSAIAFGPAAQAEVYFTAPGNNGNSPITSYTATSTPGSFTGTYSGAHNGRILITGLTVGTAYTFTVHATNSVGSSAESSASASVTPQMSSGGGSGVYSGGLSAVIVPGFLSDWGDGELGDLQNRTEMLDGWTLGTLTGSHDSTAMPLLSAVVSTSPGSVTLGTIALTAALPSVAPIGLGAVTTASLGLTTSLPATAESVTITTGTLALTAAVPAVTAAGAGALTTGSLALTAATPAVARAGLGAVTTASLALTAAVPAATAVGLGALTTGSLALTAAVTNATRTGAGASTLSSLGLTATIPNAAPVGAGAITTASLGLTAAVPNAVPAGAGAITSASLGLTAAIPAVAPTGAGTVTTATLALTASAPNVSTSAGGAASTTLAVLALTAALPSVVPAGLGTITTSSLGLTATSSSVVPSGLGAITTSSLALTVAVPSVAATGIINTTLAALALTAATPAVSRTGAGAVTVGALALVTTVPSVTATGAGVVTLPSLALTAATSAVNRTGAGGAALSALALSAAVWPVAGTGGGTVTLAALALTLVLPPMVSVTYGPAFVLPMAAVLADSGVTEVELADAGITEVELLNYGVIAVEIEGQDVANRFYTKVGATPTIRIFSRGADGAWLDLNGATVALSMRDSRSHAVLLTDEAATPVAPSGGETRWSFSYTFAPLATAGEYELDALATWGNETVPIPCPGMVYIDVGERA